MGSWRGCIGEEENGKSRREVENMRNSSGSGRDGRVEDGKSVFTATSTQAIYNVTVCNVHIEASPFRFRFHFNCKRK